MSKKKEFNFDIKQLRSYLTVLQEKNFTRASRKLKLGQATISHHILSLEEMLGVKLIERTSMEFSITREGEIFKVFCEKIFNDIDTLKSDLNIRSAVGVSRIASSTIPSAYILPKVIARIITKHKNLFYKIEVSDSREVIEMVKEGVAEVGISGRQLKHPSLTYEHIFSDEIVLIGSMKYPDTITLGDLPTIPLVQRESGSGTRNACESALSKRGIIPSDLMIVLECSNTESVKEAVTSGIGVAFVSSLSIEKEKRINLIKVIKVGEFTIVRDFYVMYLAHKHLSVPAQKLVDALRVLKRGV